MVPLMDEGHQGIGQRHMHHQYFQIKQQLLQKSSSRNGLGIVASDALAPDASSLAAAADSASFAPPTAPPKVTTITRPPAIAYRPISPFDLEVLQDVHEAFFPIKYELEFFVNVVHGNGIISWAAVDTNRPNEQCDELIGFITARVVAADESEEVDMLGCELLNSDRTLVYILTLGVIKQYRNLGIASALVGKVIQHATSLPTCRAVYLHVISYNNSAIYFYKKNSFQCMRRLRNFYYINGRHYDSYLYIYFVNGGRSRCSAIEMLTSASDFVKSIFSSLVSRIFWTRDIPRGLKWPNGNDARRLLGASPAYHQNTTDTCCV
ncbi:unnamed protein product [Calypogeia fissa]